jgi:hypothetical protein
MKLKNMYTVTMLLFLCVGSAHCMKDGDFELYKKIESILNVEYPKRSCWWKNITKMKPCKKKKETVREWLSESQKMHKKFCLIIKCAKKAKPSNKMVPDLIMIEKKMWDVHLYAHRVYKFLGGKLDLSLLSKK